jgi:hypothetical protein
MISGSKTPRGIIAWRLWRRGELNPGPVAFFVQSAKLVGQTEKRFKCQRELVIGRFCMCSRVERTVVRLQTKFGNIRVDLIARGPEATLDLRRCCGLSAQTLRPTHTVKVSGSASSSHFVRLGIFQKSGKNQLRRRVVTGKFGSLAADNKAPRAFRSSKCLLRYARYII